MPDRPKRLPRPAAPRPDARPWKDRLYGRRWKAAARAYLDAHPLCVGCDRHGRVTAAAVVDHVVPHRGDDGLFWDEANWQSLCTTCHNRKTGSGL